MGEMVAKLWSLKDPLPEDLMKLEIKEIDGVLVTGLPGRSCKPVGTTNNSSNTARAHAYSNQWECPPSWEGGGLVSYTFKE